MAVRTPCRAAKMPAALFAAICAIIAIICASIFPTACAYAAQTDISGRITRTVEYIYGTFDTDGEYLLSDAEAFPANESACNWIAMELAFAKVEDDYASYLARLEEYVGGLYSDSSAMAELYVTELQRVALCMEAMGGDPSNITYNGETYNLVADSTYNYKLDVLDSQGSNALIHALILLDSKNYEVPQDAAYTREYMIQGLSGYQAQDGGIALVGNATGDMDLTAMAIQALAPYYEENETAKNVIDSGLAFLAGGMTSNGAISSYGSESAETTAQAILALCAMGIDPENSEQFTKDSMTLLDGLLMFEGDDGGYKHMTSEEDENIMATYQALAALEAVGMLRDSGTFIYNMSNYGGPAQGAQESATAENQVTEDTGAQVLKVPVIPIITIIVAGAAIVIIMAVQKGKKGKR